MIQMSQARNSTGLAPSQLKQLCQPEHLERTLHLLFYMNHWAKARERLFFVDRQGLYAVKAALLQQAYEVGAIEATAYINGTPGFGRDLTLAIAADVAAEGVIEGTYLRKLDPERLSLISFQYTSPRAHYVFHLPFRTAETFLPAQQVHRLKNSSAASHEFGEYYGRPITESESLQNPIREILWELGVDIAAICPRQLNNKQDYELAQIMRNNPWEEDWHYNDEDEELD